MTATCVWHRWTLMLIIGYPVTTSGRSIQTPHIFFAHAGPAESMGWSQASDARVCVGWACYGQAFVCFGLTQRWLMMYVSVTHRQLSRKAEVCSGLVRRGVESSWDHISPTSGIGFTFFHMHCLHMREYLRRTLGWCGLVREAFSFVQHVGACYGV